MFKGRLLRLLALGVLVGSVATVVEVAPSATASSYRAAATPYDRADVFCTPSTAPSGTRNSSSPGVTPNSITLTDASIDSNGLRRLGVDQMDFHEAFTTYWNEINKCGGINGRKILLKTALYNPVAPDLAAHNQASCLKIAEDQKSLVAFGIGTSHIERCVSVNHKTVFVARDGGLAADFADAKGRIVSFYPTGEGLAAGFIADGVAQNTFKGKKVGVLAAAITATAASEQQDQYVDGLKKKGVDVTAFEVLPCTGTVCTSGLNGAIRRMKEKDVDLIVISHLVSVTTIGSVFRELAAQNYKVPSVGPDSDSIHSDSNMANFVRTAGTDGANWAARYGWYSTDMVDVRNAWRTGQAKDTPFARMCTATLAKALNQRQYQYNDTDITNARWGGTTIACMYVREIARAIYSLGNTVTTDRLVAALKVQKEVDARETGPDFRDKLWYSGSDIRSPSATSTKFNFPCPLPTVKNIACMLPLDRPARVRAIKY
ncbi:MAG: hypothetical protein JWN67_3545 [Actinomycetia bacterium]|nr:hypothetical protein [Actinomycetes bacterium]